ncbi:hypothetical protein BDY19DRAFT_934697 [Irpex rosettiformis]|uniref:Uncharacterized protein n=1 Tax=Irpex rosettiformis TaxID=378272 RepID=A0ACB8UAF7_9APHY|nr:hypothetical protein BDY19DRAFT_934697 [Irpex rosettiformis]
MNSTLQSIHFTPAYERVPMALFDPAEERRALADLELLQTTTIIDPHTCISAQDAASGIQANLFPGHRATNPTMMREDLSKQSLNTLIVSSSVLISPLWSMSQIPEVAKNPLMRIATYVACISCLAALATSCILRIRLMFVANAAGTASQKVPIHYRISTVDGHYLLMVLKRRETQVNEL